MKKGIKKEFNFLKYFVIGFLIVYTLFLGVQWLWAVINSFKDYYDFKFNKLGLPEYFFNNYGYALKNFELDVENVFGTGRRMVSMAEMYLYSVLYAGGCAFTSTFVPFAVSYVVARYNFKALNIVYYIVVVCMVIPLVGTLPAQVQVAMTLKIYNQMWGMWIMTGHFLGLYFLIFYATFKTISMGYTEAAKIDGASNLAIMFKVIFPLAKNMFFTVFLLYFVQYWNDYQTPLLFIPNWPTVSLGLYYMNKSVDPVLARQPGRLASCILVLIPVLVVFIIFRERLMGNLSMGGMKE